MAFAGLSYGQVGSAVTCVNLANQNPTIRQEGVTEEVGDSITQCTTTTNATTGTVTAILSATVTSKAITQTAAYVGNSDVVLQILVPCAAVASATAPACGGAPVGTMTSFYQYPGLVSGSVISFTGVAGVTFPLGTFNVQISNVRVNANTATNTQITESVQVQYNSSLSLNGQPLVASNPNGGENVGFATPSLKTTLLANAAGQITYFNMNGGSASQIPTCNGYPLSNSATATAATEAPAFNLQIQEVFANAFRTQAQEAGSFVGAVAGVGGIGTATGPTSLQVQFTNVPSAATIYLPISVTSGGTTFSLQGTGIVGLTTPQALALLPTLVFPFTPTGGTVTAVYVVTGNAGTGTTFGLNVYFNVANNGAAPVQTTAMTAAVTYTPAAAVTGPTGGIPTFAVSTATPFNTLTVTPCQTTLLFPFVTNSSGFETGLAISNMTTDNLAKNGTASSAAPSSGTCVVNFYGNTATQPTAFTTPSMGAFSASPAQAPVYANTLTSMAVPNFTGYAIALCNFLDAHGFAYIVDNFGQSSGTAEGYVADVIAGANRGGADGGLGQ